MLEREWVVFVDGSSFVRGGGVGVILGGPGKVMIKQYLKFEFKASNNQAKYEAIIAGLNLALEMGVKHLLEDRFSTGFKSDSRGLSGKR